MVELGGGCSVVEVESITRLSTNQEGGCGWVVLLVWWFNSDNKRERERKLSWLFFLSLVKR